MPLTTIKIEVAGVYSGTARLSVDGNTIIVANNGLVYHFKKHPVMGWSLGKRPVQLTIIETKDPFAGVMVYAQELRRQEIEEEIAGRAKCYKESFDEVEQSAVVYKKRKPARLQVPKKRGK